MTGATTRDSGAAGVQRLVRTHLPSTAFLLGLYAVALLAGPAGPLAPGVIDQSTVGGLFGFGLRDGLACVGCIAGFVFGGGLTLAGLAVFIAAHPQIAILCVTACASAVT
jgi:hypothetical protein